jgi:hypothetical protein
MCLLSGVDTCPNVSFFMEKLTEVPSLSFSKTQVPSAMLIETEIQKNKVFKPQVPKTSLILFFKTFYLWKVAFHSNISCFHVCLELFSFFF